MAATTRSPIVAGATSAPSNLHPDSAAPPTAPARATAATTPASGANTSGERKYAYVGGYDFTKMADLLTNHLPTALRRDNRWDSHSLPHLQILMGFINADADMVDLRWVAYMLATAYWETNHTETFDIPKLGPHHTVMKDRVGNVITRPANLNITMKPITEGGGGQHRGYHRPVKVLELPTGKIQITEYDGDQFEVQMDGTYVKRRNLMHHNRISERGTDPDALATTGYAQAQGTEQLFLGRGYAQLTWWDNYAKAGVILGLGMPFFLKDPEQALEATHAYKLMSICMRTGQGFANGRKFSMYFAGHNKNYVAARAMVNGSDCAESIAGIAQAFEDILWASRVVST